MQQQWQISFPEEQAEKAAVIDLKLLGELKDRQWPGG